MNRHLKKEIACIKKKREEWLKDGESETLSDDVIISVALSYYLDMIEKNIKLNQENNGGL